LGTGKSEPGSGESPETNAELTMALESGCELISRIPGSSR
jgi:hypothetical protein